MQQANSERAKKTPLEKMRGKKELDRFLLTPSSPAYCPGWHWHLGSRARLPDASSGQ